jgi:hypothetical protein
MREEFACHITGDLNNASQKEIKALVEMHLLPFDE